MPREHGDTGEFVETVTLDDVLGVFDAVDGPVILSADVADALDCSRETARRKLDALYDRGDVDRRKVSRRVVYWRTGGERITPDERVVEEHAEKARERDVTRSEDAADQTNPSTDATRDTTSTPAEDVRAYLETTEQPPKTPHGRNVIIDVFQLLREHGTMATGDLQERIYPDYTEHWGSERTMWNAIDRYLEDIPGIEKPGYGEWEYAGDEHVRTALDGEGEIYDPTEEF